MRIVKLTAVFFRALFNRKLSESILKDGVKVDKLFDMVAERCSESVMVCVDGENIDLFIKVSQDDSKLVDVLPKLTNDIVAMREQ